MESCHRVLLFVVLPAVVAEAACGSGNVARDQTDAGSGGSSSGGTGGATQAGGTTGAGGIGPLGGATGTGGATGSGGVGGKGGSAGGGGTIGAGGAGARGGSPGSGGQSQVDAGVSSGGGASGRGGAGDAGGAGGAGGSSLTVVPDGGTGAESFHCVNWAVNGDNFQTGPLLLSGIFSTDTTYAEVKARATAVENAFTDLLKANSFRMPINEPTVNTASSWNNYQAIIDVGVAKNMKVILGYWAENTGIGMPADINAWYTMWQAVIDDYLASPTVYFDIHNEPHGYSQQAWIQQVKDWMAKFPNVPADRIIVAGTGWDDNVTTSGAAFPGMIVEVHDYVFNASFTTPAQWGNELMSRIGSYANRTLVGEWGTGVTESFNPQASSFDVGQAFMVGFADAIHDHQMGSCWWPGLWAIPGNTSSWSLLSMNRSGNSVTYSVQNQSALSEIWHSWQLN
jgi:endoglucanase